MNKKQVFRLISGIIAIIFGALLFFGCLLVDQIFGTVPEEAQALLILLKGAIYLIMGLSAVVALMGILVVANKGAAGAAITLVILVGGLGLILLFGGTSEGENTRDAILPAIICLAEAVLLIIYLVSKNTPKQEQIQQ